MVNSGKKLMVLDINGLLLDTYFQAEARPDRPHDATVNRFYVYKRAFCEEFIQFSLQNFIVGVWSSAREHNVLALVDFMFKDAKEKLAFIWHQQHCTDTGFRHPDNKNKPVFLKELSKLWEKFEANLPWGKGDYGPSNTLLIDDSPYKAISNPRHTAIFPKTYKATDQDDNFLAGELLPYLEGLLQTTDVQSYIQRNPFGESSISASDPKWSQILSLDLFKNEEVPPVTPHMMTKGANVSLDPFVSSKKRTRPNSSLPSNIRPVPQLVGPESRTWNVGRPGDHWRRRDDHIGHYSPGFVRNHGGRDEGYTRGDFIPRGHRPDLYTLRDTIGDHIDLYSPGSVRNHGGRDEGYTRGDFNPKGPRPDRDTLRDTSDDHIGRYSPGSVRNRGGRDEGYTRGDFNPREPWPDRHRSRDTSDDQKSARLLRRSIDYGGRSREVYRPFHVSNDYKSRENWSSGRWRPSGWSGEPEGSGRGESWHQGRNRDLGGTHQEKKRKRYEDWSGDPRAVSKDERHVNRAPERSRDREPQERQAGGRFHRSSPRQNYRREGSQFKSKSMDFQRYAEKEVPRERDLSADSGRHSHFQRYDHGYDSSQHRGRRKSGKNR